ncbi:MAG: tartrate-resistant acid phosphatase type 5 family protein [bacterium]
MKHIFRSLAVLVVLLTSTALFSQKKTVATPEDDKSFKFLVMGDWGRNGGFEQQAVADQMGKFNMTFGGKCVIATGDNFYCCGVASVDDPQWMSSFENVYKNNSLQIDWYPVLGNHDYKGSPQAEIDYSKKSRRWVMPARYYTNVKKIDKNTSVRFVFMDTNPFIDDYMKKAENYADLATQHADVQLAWLDSVLSASKETWKIVVGHHPVYSSGSEHGNQPELIARLKPVFEKNNVDAYFAGHEHDLQHQFAKDGKVNYFVSGAGSEVRPAGKSETTKFSVSTPGFMAVSIKKGTMSVDVIDAKGKTLYSTSISK